MIWLCRFLNVLFIQALDYRSRTLKSRDIKPVVGSCGQVRASLMNAVDEARQNHGLFLAETCDVDVSTTDINDLHVIGKAILCLVGAIFAKRLFLRVVTDPEET